MEVEISSDHGAHVTYEVIMRYYSGLHHVGTRNQHLSLYWSVFLAEDSL